MDENRNMCCDEGPRGGCGCGNPLGNLFGGCDSSMWFIIIIFLLLFTNCGCYNR